MLYFLCHFLYCDVYAESSSVACVPEEGCTSCAMASTLL